MDHEKKIPGFDGLGIAPEFLKILEHIKFSVPTPIQHQAIPAAIEGKDLMGIAQTGTGKTLAFSLPLLQRLYKNGGSGLIIVPTRELAIQIDETLQLIGRSLGLLTAVLIGGEPLSRQKGMLRRRPNVIVATPGRLLDHVEQGTVRLDKIKILILDEADRMFDLGFAPQIAKIFALVPKERQTMLFSATMASEIVKLARSHMQFPIRIEIAPSGTAAEQVEQEIFLVRKEQKVELLHKLLQQYTGTVLVFSRTKHGARKICQAVRGMGHNAAEIHSNRSLGQRREAMAGFKSAKYRIMVATDIAARGIDVNGIELVINFDLPNNSEDYVHRIGRTGRAGKDGKAISFAMPDQKRDVADIERLIRKEIPVTSHTGESFLTGKMPTRSLGRRSFSRRTHRPRRTM